MMKSLACAAAVAGLLLAQAAPAAAESSTIRIEERPYYGAVVTLEEGVRVFRPLPPHSKIIINPKGRTPLNLTYEEHRSVSHNYTRSYSYSRSDNVDHSAGSYNGGYVSGSNHHKGNRPGHGSGILTARGHGGGGKH